MASIASFARSVRRSVGRPLPWAVLFFALAGISGLLWLYNLLASCDSLRGTHLRALLHLPRGCAAALDWIASDISTVTTVLLLATFLFPGLAARRLARSGALPTDVAEYWPFPRRLETYFLIAGIAGTLFGMLIAGLAPSSARAGIEPEQGLLEGFTTSIVSTLASLIYAFCLAPPLTACCWRIAGGRPAKSTRVDPSSLPERIGDLCTTMTRFFDALDGIQMSLVPASRRRGAFTLVVPVSVVGLLEQTLAKINLGLEAISVLASDHLAVRSILQSSLETFAAGQQSMLAGLEALLSTAQKSGDATAGASRWLEDLALSSRAEFARRREIDRITGSALGGSNGGPHAGI